MSAHTDSEPPESAPIGLADIFYLACRAGLESDLAICARALDDDANGRVASSSVESVRSSAARIFKWEQATLRAEIQEQRDERGMNTLIRLLYRPMWQWKRKEIPRFKVEPILRRRELVMTRDLAVRALKVTTGTGIVAKRLQVGAADGSPLAICIGYPSISVPLRNTGRTHTYFPAGFTTGCGAIFEDNTSGRGPNPFPRYCPDHSNKRENPRRSAEAAVKRQLRASKKPVR